MATETEAKYSLMTDHVPDAVELEAALAGQGLTSGPVQRVVHKDRYYDDARMSLSRAGFALRRRMADGRLLGTLKTLGRVEGAVHRRDEIEEPIPDSSDPWEAWPAAIAEQVRTVTDPRALRGTFELVVERVLFEIRRGRVAVAVASFDDVAARRPSGQRSVHWNELEIEIVGGGAVDPADEADVLARTAVALGEVVALVPSSQTKLERAQALLLLGAALDDDPVEPERS